MSFPEPDITPLNQPYWDGLKQGELRFQRCKSCGNCWLPARESCPKCLAAEPEWRASSGRGKIVSWVVYHTAYHDAFADRVPYDVTLVELDEGPRLLTNIVNGGRGAHLSIDAAVKLAIEREGELALARFKLVEVPTDA
jgi:uncharacterized OB-fold protein